MSLQKLPEYSRFGFLAFLLEIDLDIAVQVFQAPLAKVYLPRLEEKEANRTTIMSEVRI